MPIQLQNPERFVIYVSDMQRSTAFYRDTLGLPLKFSSPGWTEFNNEGTTLALHRRMAAEEHASQAAAGQATLVFVVDDIQSTFEALRAEGVSFPLEPQKQPSGLTLAVLQDPDGFGITLQQRQS
ncbi:MAG TPA: VOC family protein [Ktedonobacteraceae bacterium]|nr:VOC family protein [Ktedonobacteraceae bacterium]